MMNLDAILVDYCQSYQTPVVARHRPCLAVIPVTGRTKSQKRSTGVLGTLSIF